MKCESVEQRAKEDTARHVATYWIKLSETIGEKRWAAMDDCSFIYPFVRRVANGELTVHDIIQVLEVED